ncbi:MAG: pyruvate kinase [Candidatus Cyclobacteriaceae bacterium M3_2C_046]
MTKKIAKIEAIIQQLQEIIRTARTYEKKYAVFIEKVHPNFRQSAINLVHYWSLRSHDIRTLQKRLGEMGLSRLAKAESHVMASLLTNLNILQKLAELEVSPKRHRTFSIKKGEQLLSQHDKDLFGQDKSRKVRIMVTQPSDSALDPELVKGMMENGMNILRINCAHDNDAHWLDMIQHAQMAMAETGMNCRISMDLAGPKIRTGQIMPSPKAIHIRPPKNQFGNIIGSVMVSLVTEERYQLERIPSSLPVDASWLNNLKIGEKVYFKDTRGKKRSWVIMEKKPDKVICSTHQSAYLRSGTTLTTKQGEATEICPLPPNEGYITLFKDDELIIHKENRPGQPAEYDDSGKQIKPAHISCTLDEIFQYVKLGEKVLFDDGKIEGEIIKVEPEAFRVRILYAGIKGVKLRADKGINFPDSKLNISGLTEKDRKDLHFVAQHADVVNLSFVNNKNDVQDLIDEIRLLGAENKLGIILKIETKSGFFNLIEILLTAMQIYPVGVMIARGDLAIECGWENIGMVQEEILWLCQAAHIPTIWATQVLEGLAKKGIPSRAEITDAVMSQRADCVMLNKGPYIIDAIEMLDQILTKMQHYQDRKAPMLPAFELDFEH